VPFNLAATANTVQTASRAKIINANFNLAKGDRMGLSLSGTPTTLANVVVMILLKY
jgi:allophanate hydrolase subunit 2